MSPPECIFCEILAGRAEASFVYRDELCAAFMDIRPVNAGHVLVVPNRHAADLAGTDPRAWRRVAEVARRVAAALRAREGCEGVNLLLADGEVAGQEVFHAHLHVFPRFRGDGFGLRFPESYGELPSREELDAAASDLAPRPRDTVNPGVPTYPDAVIPSLRFRYCPLCRADLAWSVPFGDGVERVACTRCGWIHSLHNAVGVVSVVRRGDDLVAIQPPGEDGVALPGGLLEYGETPEEAGLREIREETGLNARIVRCLGWEYMDVAEWPGPQVLFMYEAAVAEGEPSGSSEGQAGWYPLTLFPGLISSRRHGSQSAMRLFLEAMSH